MGSFAWPLEGVPLYKDVSVSSAQGKGIGEGGGCAAKGWINCFKLEQARR